MEDKFNRLEELFFQRKVAREYFQTHHVVGDASNLTEKYFSNSKAVA